MQSITYKTLQTKKQNNEKFVCLTAYDASFAYLLDEIGIELLLVGDSLGHVIQGHTTPVPVTLDDVAYHTRCVARTTKHSLLMADMPFMTYATSEQAIRSATVLMQAGANSIKMEGGEWLCDTVRFLYERGVAVCAHIGLMAQSVYALGGYRVQGKDPEAAERLLREAIALQEAGAKLIVLECMPQAVAQKITAQLQIPTIGIGSGRYCDGQILVLYDLLGITSGKVPYFIKNFAAELAAQGTGTIREIICAYQAAVKNELYPGDDHIYA